ncbi:MAG: dihydroorotate dehydrogenase catalytic subunit [Pseudonocardiales bacterium]|nr:dihydroorotate dehydrogenase catalytic subunit [Pseudonocardiales bacterium]
MTAVSKAAVDLRVRVGALELPNPIVAASGTFGHGDEVAGLCDPAAVGAVTAKSQAPFEWAGNPPPRLHPVPTGMVNAVGLQGKGVEHWVAHDLPALRARGTRVIASIWGRSIDDYVAAAALLAPAVGDLVALEVNLSCPNLHHDSTMFAEDANDTAAVIEAVHQVGLDLPLFAKLSPGVSHLPAIAGAALEAGAGGLTLVNTVRALLIDAESRRPVLGGRGGGLSGAAIKPIALRAVHDVARAHPGAPIIGTGGVMSGVDAVEMLLAGASAVGVGTATFLEPRAMLRVLRELTKWCARHGVDRVAELTSGLRWEDA